jgi:hypothetical protein
MASNVTIKITIRQVWRSAQPDACALFQRSGAMVVAESPSGQRRFSVLYCVSLAQFPLLAWHDTLMRPKTYSFPSLPWTGDGWLWELFQGESSARRGGNSLENRTGNITALSLQCMYVDVLKGVPLASIHRADRMYFKWKAHFSDCKYYE